MVVNKISGKSHKLVSSQTFNGSFLNSMWRKMRSFGGFFPAYKKKSKETTRIHGTSLVDIYYQNSLSWAKGDRHLNGAPLLNL